MLTDKFQRQIKYLRLAVTDRCNLRCTYCMPEHMKFVQKDKLLSFEEMLRLVSLLAKHGVEKVRITGGEPFVRKGLINFLRELVKIEGIKKVAITTNGVLLDEYLDELDEIGIKDINLSLDATSKEKFFEISRRDDFDKVIHSLKMMVMKNFKVKVNMVVMEGKNTDEIIPLANFAKSYPIQVRFIEEMPFNGKGKEVSKSWNYLDIENELKKEFDDLKELDGSSTAKVYTSNKLNGSLGIIPAFTRTFCGTCDRLRITSLGELRNCLYSQKGMNLKSVIRSGSSDDEVIQKIQEHLLLKKASGFDEEKMNDKNLDSMSLIGG
ncbi:GTP 3',8-cyclase MoaA [Flammeovirga aprica]|uniref:GTP 3',8-cyclase n=1 Tax=Flammeovirga aprica JL-4 TaxID=694437 RepID=A0A7X9RVM8_9BACT|nr:GTP 3',8-cyclase MoaA [Flammeovirga aprica]NME69547.1 GTP 3',8-cyclase MoaA [Flammeovirga aprica JL-4]